MYRSLKMPKKRGCIINLISSVLDSAICGFDGRGVFVVTEMMCKLLLNNHRPWWGSRISFAFNRRAL